MLLTYAYPGTLAKRKVRVLRSVFLLFVTEALRVKTLRLRVVLGVVVQAHYRYENLSVFLQIDISSWHSIWFGTNPHQNLRRWILA